MLGAGLARRFAPVAALGFAGLAQQGGDGVGVAAGWRLAGAGRAHLAGQGLGHQQRDMRVGAFGGQRHVAERAVFVNQGQAFGTLLGQQAGGLTQPAGQGAALVEVISQRWRVQRGGVDNRVVQQPACQPMPQRGAPGFVAVGHMLAGQGLQPGRQAGRCIGRGPGGRAPHGGQQAGQRAPLHVVERIGLLVAGQHKAVLVAGHPHQHAECQQAAADGHQLAPLMLGHQRKTETAGGQRRLGRQQQQALAQQAQRDLRVGALQHRAGQAQQHVAAPVIAGQAAGGVGHLGRIGRALVEPGAVALDHQGPAGLAQEPLAQPLGLAPHRRKGLVAGVHQRAHQQRAQGAAELVTLVALLVLAQIGARSRWWTCWLGGRRCRRRYGR